MYVPNPLLLKKLDIGSSFSYKALCWVWDYGNRIYGKYIPSQCGIFSLACYAVTQVVAGFSDGIDPCLVHIRYICGKRESTPMSLS